MRNPFAERSISNMGPPAVPALWQWGAGSIAGLILLLALAACQSQTDAPIPSAKPQSQPTISSATGTANVTADLKQATTAPSPIASGTLVGPGKTSTPLQVPSRTVTPVICDNAGLVSSLTVPDGKIMEPGEPFTKTWRLKNIGACDWTDGYTLVFESGAQMGGPDELPLPDSPVRPGEEVDLSIELIAPVTPGTHKGNWKLRNAAGEIFGLGLSGGPFWVIIRIPEPTPTPTGEATATALLGATITPGIDVTAGLTATAAITSTP